MGLGWDDLLSIPTMGIYSAQKAAGGFDAGEAVKDFSNVGKNGFQATPYQSSPVNWGGEGGADNYAAIGMAGMGKSDANAAWALGQAKQNGPQAWENQDLSNQEATSRGYHQEGALNMALNGARGNAPSEAAYMLQGGLDRAIANQSAVAGSARGAGGIANASANAGANVAGLQQNAFTEAGRLRASEVANYSNMYGQLAGQQRQQDQSRLGMGNQMAQFNAQNNTQRGLGYGQLGLGYNQLGAQYYGQSAHGYDQQAGADNSYQDREAGQYGQAQALNAGAAQADADRRRANRDMWVGLGGTLLKAAPTGGVGGGPK